MHYYYCRACYLTENSNISRTIVLRGYVTFANDTSRGNLDSLIALCETRNSPFPGIHLKSRGAPARKIVCVTYKCKAIEYKMSCKAYISKVIYVAFYKFEKLEAKIMISSINNRMIFILCKKIVQNVDNKSCILFRCS